jgi:hypothetical protein
MKKPKRNTCIYRVMTTEFWRNAYAVEAENHGAALVMFECLKLTRALPEPTRTLLGVIDPPEEVQDTEGKTLYLNTPPGDDAERMLFLEMWHRMSEADPEGSRTTLYISIQFICRMKRWDPAAMLEAVRRRRL